jgi:hypothetical protein
MDIEKILALLHKLANAKIITLLLILGTAAYFIHKNLDFITEVTFKINHSSDQQTQTPPKNESNLYSTIAVVTDLIPLQFDIPSYLLITIKNNGPANANNLEALVDTGKAKVNSLDIKPKDRCSISSGTKVSTEPIRVICKVVNAGESIYIYSLLSEATFRSVLITSPNLYSPVIVKDIENRKEEPSGITFADVITFVIEGTAAIAVILIGMYLLGALINFLEKLFKA